MIGDICAENNLELIGSRPVPGGDINEAFLLKTNSGRMFLKMNDATQFPQLFQKEADGLAALKKATSLEVPAVRAAGQTGDTQYLLLEWMERGQVSNGSWRLFGEGLAQMHKVNGVHPGWHCDNYIGTLRQANTSTGSWASFYEQQRIMPLVRVLFNKSVFSKSDLNKAVHFCRELPAIFPDEPHVLLHGDLWSGNFFITQNGRPAIYDPAVYFGHREMDIGMTKLFGGFDNSFYNHYNECYPLDQGWVKRLPVTQLYPLLVHAVLFGGGYISQCRKILNSWA